MTFIIDFVHEFSGIWSMQMMQGPCTLAPEKKINEINDESDASDATPTGGSFHLAGDFPPRERKKKATANEIPHGHYEMFRGRETEA